LIASRLTTQLLINVVTGNWPSILRCCRLRTSRQRALVTFGNLFTIPASKVQRTRAPHIPASAAPVSCG